MKPRAGLCAVAALLAACAHSSTSLSRRYQQLVDAGHWLTARDLLEQNGADATPALKARLEALNEKVRGQAENLDFNPLRYFYARAYIEYFDNKRYARAAEAMSLVLSYALDNEEIVGFLDKAQALAEEQAAASKPQAVPTVAAAAARPRPPAPLPRPAAPAIVPPAQDWLEARYEKALTAYLRRDLRSAIDILRGNAAKDPGNPRWKKALERIEKELLP